jgi:hypothetical protein
VGGEGAISPPTPWHASAGRADDHTRETFRGVDPPERAVENDAVLAWSKPEAIPCSGTLGFTQIAILEVVGGKASTPPMTFSLWPRLARANGVRAERV